MSHPVRYEVFVPVAAFAFGAVIGSFLNVVIYRLPRDEEGLSVARPRLSFCPRCKAGIRWYDNIPLVSYFLLLGRCRACRAPIPLRYFVVELLTALIFTYAAVRFGLEEGSPELAVVYAALLAALLAVTFIDIDFQIIPDEIDIPGIVLAPVLALTLPALHVRNGDLAVLGKVWGLMGFDGSWLEIANPRLEALAASLLGIVAGAGLLWGIGATGSLMLGCLRRLGVRLRHNRFWRRRLANFRHKREAMGFGDVKLLGMIGGYIGWQGVLLTFGVACVTGALVGTVIKLVTRSSYIPFGPFLSLGAGAVLLFRPEILWFVLGGYLGVLR